MKIGVMQPYLFPYLGYFQLIHAVDAFVVYDDVNFIKRGWLNRNYILANGCRQRITLPLQSPSQNKLINQVEVGNPQKILKTLSNSYCKAPHFYAVYSILENLLMHDEKNLARFLGHQLRSICEYLGLGPKWYISSELPKAGGLRGQEKILSICEQLGATHYINLPGGEKLYDRSSFEARGIALSFIRPRSVVYSQFSNDFVPYLSIIDVLMFNDQLQCLALLDQYDLA